MLTTQRAGRTFEHGAEMRRYFRPTDYAVTTLDFDDIADAISGAYTLGHNAHLLARKRAAVDAIAEMPMADVCTRVWSRERQKFVTKKCNTLRAWYGGIENADDARMLLEQGWADGAARAAEIVPSLRNIVPPPKEIRRRVRWAESGTELHIDRALAGDYDVAWRNTGPHVSTPRIISLACGFSASVTVKHEELFWNAAQMLVAADVLEQAGYSVELRALKHVMLPTSEKAEERDRQAGRPHACPGYLVDITVKRAGQPLRADAVAAVFGHAGVYRTYGHVLTTAAPFHVEEQLGNICPLAPIVADASAAGIIPPCDFLLDSSFTRDDAVRQIEKVLTQLNAQNA